MRRDFITQASAQSFADAIHSRMIAADGAYADSVKAGHTKAWAIPYQDVDEDGKPVSATWWVNTKERVDKVLQASERTQLKPFQR